MSAEFARRRLVIRLQSTPDNVYINKLTNKITALEKTLNSEVEFVNYPVNGSIAVKFKNGDSYELFNYRDPYKDKKKRPPDYKPPEIEYKKLTVEIKEDNISEEGFGIFKFCLYAVLFAIAAFDALIIWFIFTQIQ